MAGFFLFLGKALLLKTPSLTIYCSMKLERLKWIRKLYQTIISSIAFYTVLIAGGFLLLSWLVLLIDFSDWGQSVKSQWDWLRLKDASTARSIASTIAAAVISLTVFSFSMVMIILNRAASQMSNRVLDTIIGNRFQQIVLGFYIGTIVYSLFLLTSIRDLDSGIRVPAISAYLLIFLTVVDLFLFIYFLHYVTQTVKYGTIIKRIHHQTRASLGKYAEANFVEDGDASNMEGVVLNLPESGYYQGFNNGGLMRWARERNAIVEVLFPVGSYVLKGTPFLKVYSRKAFGEDEGEPVWNVIDFFDGQSPSHHFYYGFLHLSEVAIKALSPGVNDPSTAVLSLNALSDLFCGCLNFHSRINYLDAESQIRIVQKEWGFEELFHKCIHPIWHYGKNDPFVRDSVRRFIDQLIHLDHSRSHRKLLTELMQEIGSSHPSRL